MEPTPVSQVGSTPWIAEKHQRYVTEAHIIHFVSFCERGRCLIELSLMRLRNDYFTYQKLFSAQRDTLMRVENLLLSIILAMRTAIYF